MPPSPSTTAGVLTGFCAWTLPLAPMAVMAGGPPALWTHFAPALLLSLGLAAAFLIVIHASDRLPPAPRARVRVGTLLWMLGVLLFAAGQELPLLLASPAVRRALAATLSLAEVPAWLPPLPMLAGLLLALPALRRRS